MSTIYLKCRLLQEATSPSAAPYGHAYTNIEGALRDGPLICLRSSMRWERMRPWRGYKCPTSVYKQS